MILQALGPITSFEASLFAPNPLAGSPPSFPKIPGIEPHPKPSSKPIENASLATLFARGVICGVGIWSSYMILQALWPNNLQSPLLKLALFAPNPLRHLRGLILQAHFHRIYFSTIAPLKPAPPSKIPGIEPHLKPSSKRIENASLATAF